jgi:rhamnogalacturonyl hydrolase YesR
MNLRLICSLICCTVIVGCNSNKDSDKIFSFPREADPLRVGILLTENLLSREYMLRADDAAIHYAEILTADGAIHFTRLIKDTSLFLQLEERYKCFLERENCELIAPKNSERTYKFQPSLAVLGMYTWTGEQKYLDCVFDLIKERWKRWENPDEVLANARYWADDMYFGSTVETRLYKITGDPAAMERVTMWQKAYVDSLQLPNGLFKHTTDVPFLWGRGVGWSAVGLTNTLMGLPENHPKRKYLMDSYLRLMEGVLPYQTSNGLWRQLIDHPDAWEETSGSAMFAYSMATGIRLGWLEAEKYLGAVEKAWIGLVAKLNENGELEEVCVGTNKKTTAEDYLDRPRRAGDHHGQGPLLWTAEALILLENE